MKKVVLDYLPNVLKKTLDANVVLDRIPTSYLKAIFASTLACSIVYTHGLKANEIDFFNHINHYSNS